MKLFKILQQISAHDLKLSHQESVWWLKRSRNSSIIPFVCVFVIYFQKKKMVLKLSLGQHFCILFRVNIGTLKVY